MTPLLTAGTNYVYHMDALRLLRMLPDASVDLICTDPPYGVGKVSAWRSPDKRFKEIEGNGVVYSDWLSDAYRVLGVGGALYCFAKWQNSGEWMELISQAGFDLRNLIIWDKTQHGAGDPQTTYAPQYEMILFATKGRHVLRGTRPVDIIRYPKIQPDKLTHPYEKPVGLLERLIRSSSDVGGVVVDLFAGSGSTMEAAFNAQRYYIGCDISAEYVELANRRLVKPFTLPMFAGNAA